MRGDRGQPFVDESDGTACRISQTLCEQNGVVCRCRARSGQRKRQPDNDLEGVLLVSDLNDPSDICGTRGIARNGLHGGGEHS